MVSQNIHYAAWVQIHLYLSNKTLVNIFFLCQLLNLVIVLINFYINNDFLEDNFSTYGRDVLNYHMLEGNQADFQPNPMCNTFPTTVSHGYFSIFFYKIYIFNWNFTFRLTATWISLAHRGNQIQVVFVFSHKTSSMKRSTLHFGSGLSFSWSWVLFKLWEKYASS